MDDTPGVGFGGCQPEAYADIGEIVVFKSIFNTWLPGSANIEKYSPGQSYKIEQMNVCIHAFFQGQYDSSVASLQSVIESSCAGISSKQNLLMRIQVFFA